jgi:hypothetical protein
MRERPAGQLAAAAYTGIQMLEERENWAWFKVR